MKRLLVILIGAVSFHCFNPIVATASTETILGTYNLFIPEPTVTRGEHKLFLHNNYLYMFHSCGDIISGICRFDMNGDYLSHEWECIGLEDEHVTGMAFLDQRMIVITREGNLYLFDIETKSIIKTFDKQQLDGWDFVSFMDVTQNKDNPETVYVTFSDGNRLGQCLKTTTFGEEWEPIKQDRNPMMGSYGRNEKPYIVYYGMNMQHSYRGPSSIQYYEEGDETAKYVDLPEPYCDEFTYHLEVLDDDRWAVSAWYLYIINNDRDEFRFIDDGGGYCHCFEDYAYENSNEKVLFATRQKSRYIGELVMIRNFDDKPEVKVLATVEACTPYFTIRYTNNQFIMFTSWGTHLIELSDDELCGIDEITSNHPSSPALFDLQGRRLQAAPQRGIYIENGRKVMK